MLSGMAFALKSIKMSLVLTLTRGTYRQNGDVISLTFIVKGSRLITDL
jgi:hypothetical protein